MFLFCNKSGPQISRNGIMPYCIYVYVKNNISCLILVVSYNLSINAKHTPIYLMIKFEVNTISFSEYFYCHTKKISIKNFTNTQKNFENRPCVMLKLQPPTKL